MSLGIPTGPTSVGATLLSAIQAAISGGVEALATAIGTWETARQSIRTVATGVAGAAMQATMNTVQANYQAVPLSPAVLADMSIRNINPGFDLPTEASYSGIDATRFAALVEDTGESYGIIDALRLWHRGSYLVTPTALPQTVPESLSYGVGPGLGDTYGITEDELDTVIYYSRVRDQFIPDLKELSWDTMSTADAIEVAVKGLATTDLAQQLFMAAGGMPEQFEMLYEASGDSVGVAHAALLYAWGQITEDQLQAVIYQSRINPRFYDIAELANFKTLSPYYVKEAVAAGGVDIETATQWLLNDGYPADQAAAMVGGAASSSTSSVKSETETMILDDYEAQIITEAEATTALTNLGYSASAIPFVLDYVTASRVITMRNAVITRVRTAFIDYLITADQATSDLTNLGLPTSAITQFLTLWQIEQQTNVKRLSAAQVGKLTEDGIITAGDAVQRWVQMGYLPEEADLLLYIYAPEKDTAAGAPAATSELPPSGTAPSEQTAAASEASAAAAETTTGTTS